MMLLTMIRLGNDADDRFRKFMFKYITIYWTKSDADVLPYATNAGAVMGKIY